MAARGGGRGDGRRRGGVAVLLGASAWLYGALLVLYPEAFRRRYSAEMRGDFRELSREGLLEGGATGLARVWTGALWDLMITALKERITMSAAARNAYISSSVDTRRLLFWAVAASLFVAVVVFWVSASLPPTYDSDALMVVGQKDHSYGKTQPIAPTSDKFQFYTQPLMEDIDGRPVAEETIRRLGMGGALSPSQLRDNLTVEPVEGTPLLRLTYMGGTDPRRAEQIANTVGQAASERYSVMSGEDGVTTDLFQKANVPNTVASPKPIRNGILTLVAGLMLTGLVVVARQGVAARSVAGCLGWRAVRQRIGQAGIPAVAPVSPSVAEGRKEKELLEALARRGKLAAVGAALETSLTVWEAGRMLQALAEKGHLEVSSEHGRLLYGLWEGDAPL